MGAEVRPLQSAVHRPKRCRLLFNRVSGFGLTQAKGKAVKSLYLVPLLAVAACAQAPEKIEPVSVSPSAYDGASCNAVRAEHAAATARLAVLYGEQRHARTQDTAAVIIVGAPLASLNGEDRAPEIASLKGQVAAMEDRLRGC